MAILITGAAGFIGSHLAAQLKKEDEEIILLDNFNSYYNPAYKRARVNDLIGKEAKILEVDIQDYEALKRVFENKIITHVIHLAAQPGVRYSLEDPLFYIENNVKATGYILDLARQFNIEHFVFASSSSVYGNSAKAPFKEDDDTNHPISPYAASKKAGEVLAHSYHEAFGLPVTVLRFFTVYGPWNRPDMAAYQFIRNAFEEKPITVFDHGNLERDFTYIDDIVDGIIKALWNNHGVYKVYNLGNSSPIKVGDFIAKIRKITGKTIKQQFMTKSPGDVLATHADITRAKEELGWEPKIEIDTGLSRTIEWFKNVRIGPY